MTTETDRPSIEDVIKDMGDDALAETAKEMRAEGKRLLDMAGHAEFTLVNRMVARGATKLDTEHWTGALTPGLPSHTIDDEKMMGLRDLVSEEDWSRARVQPPAPAPHWDKRALNELAKRGGGTAAVIEDATISERGRPKLKLERKEEAQS
jgi:hypothetical protein